MVMREQENFKAHMRLTPKDAWRQLTHKSIKGKKSVKVLSRVWSIVELVLIEVQAVTD